jgi:hypothetical protein
VPTGTPITRSGPAPWRSRVRQNALINTTLSLVWNRCRSARSAACAWSVTGQLQVCPAKVGRAGAARVPGSTIASGSTPRRWSSQ